MQSSVKSRSQFPYHNLFFAADITGDKLGLSGLDTGILNVVSTMLNLLSTDKAFGWFTNTWLTMQLLICIVSARVKWSILLWLVL